MRGVILAAGQGNRLRPLTESLPKTLLTVDGETTILEVGLANLAKSGVEDVALVTGFASEQIEGRIPFLEDRYRLSLTTIFNDKATIWNNAYSLFLACPYMTETTLLVNSDTVHPISVEESLLAAQGRAGIILAIDDVKVLGEEEMKLHLDDRRALTRINKALDPATAHGEYIGVSLIEPEAVATLADCLEATFERDANLYYEDGYQEFVDRGHTIGVAPIGRIDWIEVDSIPDLERAREIACRY